MDDQMLQKAPVPTNQQKTKVKRSRTGCLYCRRRKIKCDENYPSCGECAKVGRRCDTTTPIFRQYKSSVAVTASPRSPSRRAESSARSVTTENSWVQILSEAVVFVSNENHGHDPVHHRQAHMESLGEDPSILAGTSPDSTTSRDIDAVQRVPKPAAESTTSLPEHHASRGRVKSPTSLHPNQPSPQNSRSSPLQTRHEAPAAEHAATSTIDETRETSFFLRHFSETPGMWMDLFDLDYYYSRQVPVLARHNPLVKYAACAFAAKQLGRVHGRRAVRGGVASRLSAMERWPENYAVDYTWFGMKYYDRSISLLMECISEGNHGHQDDYNRRLSDETIVAATMLCNYEFLSATTAGWSRHLDGTQSLLRLTNQEGLFQFQPSPRPSPVTPTPPKALRAAFWNFARQDFLASIITRKHTRLNSGNLTMWCAMGLVLDETGYVSPIDLVETSEVLMQDDMVSNALVWLLCKIANFVATNSSEDHSDTVEDDQQATTWKDLNLQLNAWHERLPITFQASARIELTECVSPNLRWEAWYSNSMCASTMQSYHMARILLLIYRPARLLLESSSHTSAATSHRPDLLSGYRSMQIELRGHAVEICAIAQGRPDDPARIHMLQPLYFAGRCLTNPKDQDVVIGLIRDIEKDLGWATEYRVEQLLQEWEA